MRWLTILFAVCLQTFAACADAVVLMTWNMKWFPSGRADIRRKVSTENARIATSARMLSDAFRDTGGQDWDGLIAFVEEMRDRHVCADLATNMTVRGVRVAAVSDFRDKAGYPLWQQNAILSNLPLVEGGFHPWQSERHVEMPRGFAFAVFSAGDSLIAAFCVHLKANTAAVGDEFEIQKNIYKREFAASQILEKLRELRQYYGEKLRRVVVAGDFNTNDDDDLFVSEATLRAFYGAHFRSCFRGLKKEQRVTHPGTGDFPDSTLDYILYRGFNRGLMRKISSGKPVSDHNIVSVKLPLD